MTQTITGLTPLSILPRNREVPTGIGSGVDLKATGQQIVDMVQTGVTAIHSTSVTLTAAEIFGGTIRCDTTSGNITLNLPTASDLYSEFGSNPPVGTYIDCTFENESINVITLASTDVNLVATGLISVFISPLRKVTIRFTVTQITTPIQLTMDGGSADYYAAITSGSIDSAVIGSITPPNATVNNLTINGTFTWPIVSANSLFVDANGSNSNSGSQYKPFLNISFAVGDFNQYQIIKIGEGDFTETSALVLVPTMSLFGNGQNDTQILSSGISISINWPDISSPYLYIQNLLISDSNSINLIAPSPAANSSINLSNVSIDPTEQPLSVGMVYNSIFSNNVQATNVTLQDIGNFQCIGSNLSGTLTINCLDQTYFPTQNYYIDGSSLTQILVNSSLGVNITVTVLNSPNLSNFTSSVSGGTITYNFDNISFPINLSLSGGEIVVNLDRAYSLDTTQGFAVTPIGPLEFSWTGDGSLVSGAYTLLSGRGAHITGGTDNILLGKSATTNWVGGFMFCDSTNSSGGAYFPQGNNQIIFNGAGGFGIGNNSNTGVLGPQAGFHYANYNGNDGNFLFSGAGAVITANMNIKEINPYITGSTFSIQFKDSFGTGYTITTPAGGGTIPFTNSINSFTNKNTFSALSVGTSGQFLDNQLAIGITTSGTLTPAQLLAKVIVVSSSSTVNLDWGTASTILAAMTNPVVGSTINLFFVNKGTGQLNLTNTTDPTHIGTGGLIGASSVPIVGGTIFLCQFSVTNISPAAFAIFGGPYAVGATPGSALLAASNVFTGLVNEFNTVNMSYSQVNGPSVITSSAGFAVDASGVLSGNSFTLTAAQAVNGLILLNGSLTSQTVFMPTAAAFDAQLLASFPAGASIPTQTAYWMRVINISATATATLTGNTNFAIFNTGTSTFSPGQRDTVMLVKTANTPEYTVY